MKLSPTKSSPISNSRCAHRFANGKRCADFARTGSEFCLRHADIEQDRREADDVSATLTSGLDNLKSPAAIHDLLSRLLLLLAQDRISPRRAAVMFYGSGLLLRATAAIENDADRPPTKIEYVLGGWAKRDEPETPAAEIEPASAI